MAKFTLIIFTFCLTAATMDMAWGVCPNCNQTVDLTSCRSLSSYKDCLNTVLTNSTCVYGEIQQVESEMRQVKAYLCYNECSGVSALLSSLGLVLTFSGVAHLLKRKY